MSGPYDLLIVGGGPAGFSAARAFRAAGGSGAVAIVTDERRMPYSRPPLSKELLRAEMHEDELLLEAEAWLDEQRVDLVGGEAIRLDPDRRELLLTGGRVLEYRACVLATGAEPTRLAVPGADHPGVRTLRSLDDLRELKRRLVPGSPVSVIGSGFIGCEIAASLRLLNHPVALISDETAPNVARLGAQAGAEIARWLAELGVSLHLGTGVTGIERASGCLRVLGGERPVSSAVIIMATGVAPRGELAGLAGAKLAGGAIATDERLQTTLPGVLAAGDANAAVNATAGRRLRVEHWGDALGQGQVAGRVAAGEDATWSAVPGFWSTIGRRTLKFAAWGDGFDQTRFEPDGDAGFTVWYGREGRLVGVLAHENDVAYERGRELIGEGASWS